MGKLIIREEGSTPATPTEGVILFPTVATPSILKLLDDAGTLTTFALLEKTQNFTTTQVIAPNTTGANGLVVNMPTSTTGIGVTTQYNGVSRQYAQASSTVNQYAVLDFDNGALDGPHIYCGRNSNAGTPSAGFMYMMNRGGTGYAIWVDASANVRVGTSLPTNANDGSGTIIGTQTSSLDTKDVLDEFTANGDALRAIINTPLYRFRYKTNRFDQEFMGIVTDYAPLFGMDRDEEHPAGKALNEINAHGYEMAAIKALAAQVTTLTEHVAALTARLNALEGN